jgi:hypothetical protein
MSEPDDLLTRSNRPAIRSGVRLVLARPASTMPRSRRRDRRSFVGRDVAFGRWTFEIVEEYDLRG